MLLRTEYTITGRMREIKPLAFQPIDRQVPSNNLVKHTDIVIVIDIVARV